MIAWERDKQTKNNLQSSNKLDSVMQLQQFLGFKAFIAIWFSSDSVW